MLYYACIDTAVIDWEKKKACSIYLFNFLSWVPGSNTYDFCAALNLCNQKTSQTAKSMHLLYKVGQDSMCCQTMRAHLKRTVRFLPSFNLQLSPCRSCLLLRLAIGHTSVVRDSLTLWHFVTAPRWQCKMATDRSNIGPTPQELAVI